MTSAFSHAASLCPKIDGPFASTSNSSLLGRGPCHDWYPTMRPALEPCHSGTHQDKVTISERERIHSPPANSSLQLSRLGPSSSKFLQTAVSFCSRVLLLFLAETSRADNDPIKHAISQTICSSSTSASNSIQRDVPTCSCAQLLRGCGCIMHCIRRFYGVSKRRLVRGTAAPWILFHMFLLIEGD